MCVRVVSVAHRSQMPYAVLQSLFAAIETTGKQVPPETHGALPATEKTGIPLARIFGGACETSHHALVRRIERARDAAIPHAQQSQHARGLLAEDVARGCRRDALARKQDDAVRTFGGKSCECAAVGPGQSLASGDPPRSLAAFSGREAGAVKVRGIDGVNGLGKTGSC